MKFKLLTFSITFRQHIWKLIKSRYSLKELGLLFSVSILQIRPSIFKEIFWRFLAHFLNFVKKNQNSLKGFFNIFSTFFNVKEDPGCFWRFFVNFQQIFQFYKEEPGYLRRFFGNFQHIFQFQTRPRIFQEVLYQFLARFSIL